VRLGRGDTPHEASAAAEMARLRCLESTLRHLLVTAANRETIAANSSKEKTEQTCQAVQVAATLAPAAITQARFDYHSCQFRWQTDLTLQPLLC
jgi:hypothetical protein